MSLVTATYANDKGKIKSMYAPRATISYSRALGQLMYLTGHNSRKNNIT